MTTVILKSDSESKIEQLLKLAEELGVSAEKQEVRELTDEDMVHGIGKKATDEELENYLFEEAFAEYLKK